MGTSNSSARVRGQCRLPVSVATEGSPEPGPRGEQERPWPRTSPRLLPGSCPGLTESLLAHPAPTWGTVSTFP